MASIRYGFFDFVFNIVNNISIVTVLKFSIKDTSIAIRTSSAPSCIVRIDFIFSTSEILDIISNIFFNSRLDIASPISIPRFSRAKNNAKPINTIPIKREPIASNAGFPVKSERTNATTAINIPRRAAASSTITVIMNRIFIFFELSKQNR